jgi:transmembrane sensor
VSDPKEEPRWGKNAREIQARAAAWIEERESDEWPATRQAEFDAWVAESPAHLVAFLRAETVWKHADRLRALSSPGPMKPNTAGPSMRKTPLLKIAAAFAVVSLACGGAFALLQAPKTQTYSTTIGGRETLTLDDGSQIELNTNTSVRVAYDSGRRDVWLDKGEAYFNVVHNPSRPFTVSLGDRRVTDLGTKFFIRRDRDRIQVALVEGRARFDASLRPAPAQQTVLTPGDIVTATAESISLRREPNQSLSNQLGWRRGMLVFDHATLAEVADEYNRYNRTKLVIADAHARHLTISGTLPATDLGAFTRLAIKFFNLRIQQRDNEIVVSR